MGALAVVAIIVFAAVGLVAAAIAVLSYLGGHYSAISADAATWRRSCQERCGSPAADRLVEATPTMFR